MSMTIQRISEIFQGNYNSDTSKRAEVKIYYLTEKELEKIRIKYPSKPYKKPMVIHGW